MDKMELKINIENVGNSNCDVSIDNVKFQKMLFLYNAINDGWTIKKRGEAYTFIKNHEGKKEVFSDSYLLTFVKSNLDMGKLLA